MPHFDSTQLNELYKNLTSQFNKNLEEAKKTDLGKKKATDNKKKPQVNMSKGVGSAKGGSYLEYDDEGAYDDYYDDYNY
jgi:hypothetical protein